MLVSAIVLTVVTWIAASYFHMTFNRRWAQLTLIPAILLSFIPVPLLLGLLILAVTKAALVGLYFMHLIYEGNWVYLMLVPAAFLAMVFMVGLYPDIAMTPGPPPETTGEEVMTAPLVPSPAAALCT
jgi:hypothetical protein